MSIRPYRTIENAIEGVVMTFTDITSQKEAMAAAEADRQLAENIVATVREPLLLLSGDLRVVSANRAFYDLFQVDPQATQDQFIYDLGNRQWDIPQLRVLLEKIIPEQAGFEDFLVEHNLPDLGPKKMLLNGRQLKHTAGQPEYILLAIEEVTNEGLTSR